MQRRGQIQVAGVHGEVDVEEGLASAQLECSINSFGHNFVCCCNDMLQGKEAKCATTCNMRTNVTHHQGPLS